MTYFEIDFLADVLLVSGAIGAALYCHVLSRRLRKFTDLEKGIGGAVAVLAVQANDLQKALDSAQLAASGSVENLIEVNERAEAATQKLELLMASLHDLPERPDAPVETSNPFFVRPTNVADHAQ